MLLNVNLQFLRKRTSIDFFTSSSSLYVASRDGSETSVFF